MRHAACDDPLHATGASHISPPPRPVPTPRTDGRLGTDFGRLWTASTISNLGDGLTRTAGPLLAASLTRDPILVSGVLFAQTVPWLLFGLLAGAIADRVDRRRLMAAVDLFRAVAIGALGVAVILDAVSLPLLYVAGFIVGCAETLFDTSAPAVLPAIVRHHQLERANGRLVGGRTVTNQLLGPPLGGLLFGIALAAPFLIDAASFAVAALLVLSLRVRIPIHRSARRTRMRDEIAEGIRWLRGHLLLRGLVVAIGVMNLTFGSVMAVLVLWAQDRLGLAALGYGRLIGASAVGGILGSAVGPRLIDRFGAGTALRVGLLIEVTTHVVLALAPNAWIAGIMLTIFGVHAVIWNITVTSLRQRLVPARMLGRVGSIYDVAAIGSIAIGSLVGGVLASTFGITAPFWFSAVVISGLIVVLWPVLGEATDARPIVVDGDVRDPEVTSALR